MYYTVYFLRYERYPFLWSLIIGMPNALLISCDLGLRVFATGQTCGVRNFRLFHFTHFGFSRILNERGAEKFLIRDRRSIIQYPLSVCVITTLCTYSHVLSCQPLSRTIIFFVRP